MLNYHNRYALLMVVCLVLLSRYNIIANNIQRLGIKSMARNAGARCFSSIEMKSSSGKTGKTAKKAVIETSSSQTSPVQRVTNNINISVRQQIAWAKAYKRLMSSDSSNPKSKTRFRQVKGTKEEDLPDEYVGVDYDKIKPPAVFIDGYNIIGYINTSEGRNLDFEEARDCLINDLSVLKGATGWHIEVVFDAYKTGGVERNLNVENISVTFTSAAETADNFIERRFEELRRDGYRNIVVATDDGALRMIAGSAGGGYLPASMLVEEFRIAYRGWDKLQEDLEMHSRRNKPTIGDGVSNDIKNALQKMREQQQQQQQQQQLQQKQRKSPPPT